MAYHCAAEMCNWQCFLLIFNLCPFGNGLHVNVHRLLKLLHPCWLSAAVLDVARGGLSGLLSGEGCRSRTFISQAHLHFQRFEVIRNICLDFATHSFSCPLLEAVQFLVDIHIVYSKLTRDAMK